MKEWHLYDKVFRRWVVYLIGPADEFIATLNANRFKEDTEWFSQAKGATVELNSDNNDNGQNVTIVWLLEYESATLVHEISHLVMMLFDQCGVPISRDNSETFAFYSEYWFTQMQRVRKKYPNGNKPKDAK